MTDTPQNTPSDALRSVALAPGQIEVGERLRKAKPHRVAVLAADMQVQGQLQPILVCEAETAGKYQLVDGGQRLAALIAIKAAFVEAVVVGIARCLAETQSVSQAWRGSAKCPCACCKRARSRS